MLRFLFVFNIFLLFYPVLYSQNKPAVECLRAQEDSPCYGECGKFIDENENGICDVWEFYRKDKQNIKSSNSKELMINKNKSVKTERKSILKKSSVNTKKSDLVRKDKITEEVDLKVDKHIQTSSTAVKEKEKKDIPSKKFAPTENPNNSPDEVNYAEKIHDMDWVFVTAFTLLFVFILEFLKGRYVSVIVINDISNWALLVSFTLCCLTGFFLYFGVFENIRKLNYEIHIYTGFIAFIITVYHLIKRIWVMWPFRKK